MNISTLFKTIFVLTIVALIIVLTFMIVFLVSNKNTINPVDDSNFIPTHTTEPMVKTQKSIEEQIYDILIQKGFSSTVACGIMGNMKAESNMIPNNLQNSYNYKFEMTDEEYTMNVDCGNLEFVHDKAGYGLLQFTFSGFKKELLNTAKENNKSISDIEIQIDVLIKLLNTNEFNSLNRDMNNMETPKEVAIAFMLRFERPANQSEVEQVKRAGYAEEFFSKFN